LQKKSAKFQAELDASRNDVVPIKPIVVKDNLDKSGEAVKEETKTAASSASATCTASSTPSAELAVVTDALGKASLR
jgi:hypothetical protein